MRILFLASNPNEEANLRLEAEITQIQRRVVESAGELVSCIFLPDLHFEDLPSTLLKYSPDVLHISAHGDDQELTMANTAGAAISLTAKSLLAFMRRQPPRLVYINACNSHQIAAKLSEEVDVAIGSTAPITNRAARGAAAAFFERVLAGSPLGNAIEVAQEVAECMQAKTVSLRAHARQGVAWEELVLHRVPRLVAQFKPEPRPGAQEDASIKIQIGLSGCPTSVTQLVVFTDGEVKGGNPNSDMRYPCAVTRRRPIGSVLWLDADQVWEVSNNVAIFAAGSTSDQRTFSVASTAAEALDLHYRSNRKSADGQTSNPRLERIAHAIERIRSR